MEETKVVEVEETVEEKPAGKKGIKKYLLIGAGALAVLLTAGLVTSKMKKDDQDEVEPVDFKVIEETEETSLETFMNEP